MKTGNTAGGLRAQPTSAPRIGGPVQVAQCASESALSHEHHGAAARCTVEHRPASIVRQMLRSFSMACLRRHDVVGSHAVLRRVLCQLDPVNSRRAA